MQHFQTVYPFVGIVGMVQPRSGVCSGWILRSERGERMPQTSVLSWWPSGEGRCWAHDRPDAATLQLRVLCLPCSRQQVQACIRMHRITWMLDVGRDTDHRSRNEGGEPRALCKSSAYFCTFALAFIIFFPVNVLYNFAKFCLICCVFCSQSFFISFPLSKPQQYSFSHYTFHSHFFCYFTFQISLCCSFITCSW